MSRLQKKIPLDEKKKRRVDAEEITEAGTKPSVPKSIAPAVVPKKIEKGSTESKSIGQNHFQEAIEFFREVKVELKKVTWPTRKQTTGTTIVVIIFVFVVAAFLGLFDYGLAKLVQVVLT